jgi:predicted phage tail protein
VIETIERWGVTNRDQAWRDTRYDMAVAELRPDTYEITTDIEHLLCTRGDLVRVSHDVPRWGITSGRIRAVELDAGDVVGLTLDETVPMEAGGSYAVRIRRADASSVVAQVVTAAGEQAAIALDPPIPAAHAPAAGDLFLFGGATRESVELIVREIRPAPDLGAVLTLVPAAIAREWKVVT